jgi:hypothetical protein
MPKKDSLLAHCLARAVIADAGGLEAANEKYGEDGAIARAMSPWKQVKLATKVTPKASRTAGFIILWAWAMKSEGRDSFSITEYQRYYNEGERQAYRSQSEFRELWPEFETPNELARQIVKHLDKRPGPGSLPTSVPVVA